VRAPRLALLFLGLAACRCSGAPAPSSIDGAAPRASAASAAPAPRPPSPRLTDPRWIAARDEDPLERARLASELGASELLDALDDGGEIEATALAALPYADDAELALGPLAERAEKAEPAQLGAILEAILAIAGQPRRPRELVDPEGARYAGAVTVAIAGRAELPRELRALAVSAARALAEKGFIETSKIPTDLDPQ